MEQVISFVALAGMAVAAVWGMKWMGRAGRAQSRRDNPLSPADLKLLEETAQRLMADLRATADECVARVDAACERARSALDAHGAKQEAAVSALQTGESAADAARRAGVPTGEVELLRGLRAISLVDER